MIRRDETLEAMIAEDSKRQAPQDKLEFVRNQVREMRDLTRRINDVEELAKQLRGQRREMEMQILPDLFLETGVTHIGLAAEGNEPPYEAKIQDHYHANIAVDWPQDKRDAALTWLKKNKLKDIIKTVIVIEIGLGESVLTARVLSVLKELKVKYTAQQTVPWNTLTAAVKEMYRDGKVLSDTVLNMLGAHVGKIVRLKPKKED
jgi:hypothetical protein